MGLRERVVPVLVLLLVLGAGLRVRPVVGVGVFKMGVDDGVSVLDRSLFNASAFSLAEPRAKTGGALDATSGALAKAAPGVAESRSSRRKRKSIPKSSRD